LPTAVAISIFGTVKYLVLFLFLGCTEREPMPELKAHARTHTIVGRVESRTPRAIMVRDERGRRHALTCDAASPRSAQQLGPGEHVRAVVVAGPGRTELVRELEVKR
jgi:hypothetical protein